MTYKRATKQLCKAGIYDIEIRKGKWGGVYLNYPGLFGLWQTSRCFDSWQEAVRAAIGGYRPSVSAHKGACYGKNSQL